MRSASALGSYNDVEVSGYGRYTDPDNRLYALGDVSYGSFRNTLNRTIVIPGMPVGQVRGKFDSNVVGLYGEGGYRLNTDSALNVTPYVALAYLDASASPYTETGNFVAPLQVASSSSQAVDSYIGATFAQTWAMGAYNVTPSLKAAWEHDFTNDAWIMNASFAPVSTTASFSVNGSALAKDYAFIDAGVTISGGDIGGALTEFKLGYQGRMSSDITENSFVARAVFNF